MFACFAFFYLTQDITRKLTLLSRMVARMVSTVTRSHKYTSGLFWKEEHT